MAYVDFILNLAGLLLWLNWRSVRFDPLAKRTPATLVGTLRRAEPARTRRWHQLAMLGGLLVLRALLYWQIGSTLSPVWAGKLNLGVIVLSIPCHDSMAGLGRMLLFSGLSFGLVLGIFYLWLLLLSLLAGPEPLQRLVRIPLGRVDGWPRGLKLFLPLAVTVLLGVAFLCGQAYEYTHSPFNFYHGGIFASSFFIATGFHGVHVIIGTIFLIVCLFRAMNGQFNPQRHFGFEAAAWYWHFVDVVWLFLFVCIYFLGRSAIVAG